MSHSTHHQQYQAFLEVLRQLRLRTGVTQTALGERIGNTQTFVSKVERGERRLDLVEFTEWCEALDLSPEKAYREYLAARPAVRTSPVRSQKLAAKRRR